MATETLDVKSSEEHTARCCPRCCQDNVLVYLYTVQEYRKTKDIYRCNFCNEIIEIDPNIRR